MENKNEKKPVVITGRTVLRIIGVLVIISLLAFTIIELVAGTPFLEIFTENPFVFGGGLLPVFVIFFLFGDDDKKSKKSDEE